MNLHEYQGKEILEKFNVKVQKGYVADNIEDAVKCAQKIQKETGTGIFVIKAQIHAGGRGKAGGIKLVKNKDVLKEASNMLGKILITPQTGSKGKKVNRLYIEEATKIEKEFYLSCLVDRASSKIAIISCTEGGVDIEKIAKENPEKIITTRFDLKDKITEHDLQNNKICKYFFY